MSFLRKGILASGGQVLCVFLGLGANIVFARVLGKDDMGQLELFRSMALVVATALAMGFGPANIYFLNNQNAPAATITTNAVKTALAMGLLVCVGLVPTVLCFRGYFGEVMPVIAAIFALGVAAQLGKLMLRPILVAKLAVRRYVLVDVVSQVVLVAGAAALAIVHLRWRANAQAAIAASALAFLAALVLLLVTLRRDVDLRRPYDWQLGRRVFAYGIKLGAAVVMAILSQHITVLLLHLRTGEFGDVGLYTRAVAMTSLVVLVPRSLGPLLYAKWAGAAAENRRDQAEMALRMNIAYGVAAAAILLVAGKFLIMTMYGREFMPGHVALRLLAPAMVCVPIFAVCGNLLAADGRAGVTVKILFVAVLIIAAVTYISVPALGIQGAALGVLCGNAVSAVAGMIACAKLYGVRPHRCLILTRSDLRYVKNSLRRRSKRTAAAPPDLFHTEGET